MGYRSTSVYGQSNSEISSVNYTILSDTSNHYSLAWKTDSNLKNSGNVNLLPSYKPSTSRVFDTLWHRCPVRSLCHTFHPEDSLIPPVPELWKVSQSIAGVNWSLCW